MRVKELCAFIIERENIRIKKEAGEPRPWTKDPILGKFRFCNVHREDDKVTRWLRTHWYPVFAGNPDVWFAAVVARLLNLPESLDEIGVMRNFVLPWQPAKFSKILHERKEAGEKNFNAAYIVSTNGVAMDKIDYLVERVLNRLWKNRHLFTEPTGESFEVLDDWHNFLTKFNGQGSFIAAQVIADIKYIEPWSNAPDWHTFAASGPGSRRGLNRVMGAYHDDGYPEHSWLHDLAILREAVNQRLPFELHAQDLQNCLCEFDKYERARLGQGTPKQIYKEK